MAYFVLYFTVVLTFRVRTFLVRQVVYKLLRPVTLLWSNGEILLLADIFRIQFWTATAIVVRKNSLPVSTVCGTLFPVGLAFVA
jgi:hypothetical protein